MRYIEKLILIIIIAILLVSIVYFIFFSEEKDTEAPEFISVTENITGIAGEIVRINVLFSDNIAVTNATLYYQSENENKWNILSVLNGSTNITIPSNSDDDIFFYYEINDEAGNGPVRSPIQNNTYYIISVTKEDDNGDNQNDNESSHIVFVEEGSATWCSNCPDVAEDLHDLFDSDNPDFYYVSLVEDKNSKAEDRLYDDYNILGFPTVYIDGGFEVIYGPDDFRSRFLDALSDANNREFPNIYLNLTSEWNETNRELKNTVKIKNNDDEKYSGRLKIYITEINSSWKDYNKERYTYTLIDYGYNSNIQLNVNESKTISNIWEASDNIDENNLFIIGVVFNSESKSGNSDPNDNTKPFNAYYTDAAHGVKVTKEISVPPPSISLLIPFEYDHYIFGRKRDNSLLSVTYIIGKLTIEVDTEANAGIDRVEYHINGPIREFTETLTESPYSYEWDRFSFGKYTITVTLYDNDGKTATDTIEVYKFNL
jgi:hypothetical protein